MKQKFTSGASCASIGMKRPSCHNHSISRKSHYLGIMLLLLTFISISSFAQAQWSNGDVITISSGNNYLAINGSSITSVTSVTVNALWEVSVTNASGTNRYSFKNVGNGQYLAVPSNWGQYSLILVSSVSSVSQWTLSNSKLANVDRNVYLRYNKGWSLVLNNNNASTLSFKTYTKNDSFTYSGANPLLFAAAGETLNVTASAFPSYSNGSTVIPMFDYAVAGNGFTVNSSGTSSYQVTASSNSGTPRSGTLTLTSTINSATQLVVNFLQTSLIKDFNHQQGKSGRAYIDNGNGLHMQGVHEQRFVIYVPINGSRTLEVPETSMSYSRWYNYKTDETAVGLSGLNNYSALSGNAGLVKISNGNVNVNHAIYSNTSSITSGVIDEIACDLSYYKDYTGNQSNLQVEPTLSHRMIYEIRPAIEMATALSSCTGTTFLEEYTIIAPAEQTLRFGPQYKYHSSNSNYYYLQGDNPIQVTSGTWTASSGAVPSNVQNDRVVRVDGSSDGTTVIYELTSKIGRAHV